MRKSSGQFKITSVKENYGSRLVLNFFGCPREKITNVEEVCGILEIFPEKLGLGKRGIPSVFKYVGEGKEEWGVSGAVLTEDAHLSIHTFPDSEQAFVSIFSTNDFDADRACRELKKSLGAKDHDMDLISSNNNFVSGLGRLGSSLENQRIIH